VAASVDDELAGDAVEVAGQVASLDADVNLRPPCPAVDGRDHVGQRAQDIGEIVAGTEVDGQRVGAAIGRRVFDGGSQASTAADIDDAAGRRKVKAVHAG